MNSDDKRTLKEFNIKGWRNKDVEFTDEAQKFICKHALQLLDKTTFTKGVKL